MPARWTRKSPHSPVEIASWYGPKYLWEDSRNQLRSYSSPGNCKAKCTQKGRKAIDFIHDHHSPQQHSFLLGWNGEESREVRNLHPSFQLLEGCPRACFLSLLTQRAHRNKRVWMTWGYRKKGRVGASFCSTRGPVVLQIEARATWYDQEKACN